MTDLIVKKNFHAFSAEITPPGDKSISHRAIILGSLARGKTRARGFLSSRDTLATVNAVRHMGIDVNVNAGEVQILGNLMHAQFSHSLHESLAHMLITSTGELARCGLSA